MSNLWNRAAVGILSLIIPIAAWADLSGVATVAVNSTLNLDTGATSTSGGDLSFDGSNLTGQGNAKAFDAGNLQLAGQRVDPG